ncbi:alpha/beta fold hydrolase [Neorhizobium lilium]|uniref:Alpha/beta fold hydrolase n=2 Tax=Neorhizobium lilium TaxID=2503024 RepID=A0A3S3RJ61_9HYPH|nr:alpha/beta fold hydrolase [Neorhizobium lilium]
MPLAICVIVSGCATRPDAGVLQPVADSTLVGKPSVGERIRVLTATNRQPEGKGFSATPSDNTTYEAYDITVPPDRKGAEIAYASHRPDPQRQYIVRRRAELSEAQFETAVGQSASSDGTVGVFVHGYNYSYQEALFRTAQVAVDANVGAVPVLFSWPSAASVTGYVADRDAVLYSRRRLDALLDDLSSARNVKRIVLFGHSMGAFLAMEAVRELKLQHRQDVLDKLEVILASPDIDVDVFRSQLREIGAMKTPITLLVARTDRALQVSSLIANDRARIGRLDIDDPVIQAAAREEHVRVIDITAIDGTDGLGHDRFASLARFGSKLRSFDGDKKASAGDVGAYVFDAAGALVSSPFRLAGSLSRAGQ